MQLDNVYKEAIDLINKSERILITTHHKPDGDAIGSLSTMNDALVGLGKSVTSLILSPMPEWYKSLFPDKVPVLGEDIKIEEVLAGQLGQFDLILIVDTNSPGQLNDFKKYIKQTDTPILVIDHHRTSDGLGALEIVESQAAAAGLVIFDFIKYAGWEITKKMAESMFIAISTDTGWFKFNNTDSRVFEACSELIELGVKPSEINNKLYETSSYERIKLKIAMLNTLELYHDGRYAAMQLLKKDFDNTGGSYTETENLINEAREIKTVDVTALFIELGDGRIRCSLRSKGAFDVGKIAAKFGGGGHKMAAGTFVPGPIENAKQSIFNEISEILD
ncbi:MAG: bifunctional oligoribonuclease/PAP phosphatase NrnA [Sedimentisphaerales bacterium]|nr:bifunctional oligoribonuclease/PAP phosphatase NrnA [Sedimentisphaerales bacterium]